MLGMRQPDCEKITMVAPSGGVIKDVPVVIGSICVIPESTEVAGALFAGFTMGVFSLPKATGGGTNWAAGTLVDWDHTNSVVKTAASVTGDWNLGYVRKAVLTTDTTVEIVKVTGVTAVH